MVVPTKLVHNRSRAVFLSDLHLGWCWARLHRLATLIGELSRQKLNLVGDTFDWLAGVKYRWDSACQSVIQAIDWLQAQEFLLIPGNHDWQLAQNKSWRGWSIQTSAIHTTQSVSRFLVSHGDAFDCFQSMHGTDIWRSVGRRLYPTILAIESRGILPPPNAKHWNGTTHFLNWGDWVEHQTVVTETERGEIVLM